MTSFKDLDYLVKTTECADGGIGRHVRLRGVCASVRVQVPLRAPNFDKNHKIEINDSHQKKSSHQITKKELVLPHMALPHQRGNLKFQVRLYHIRGGIEVLLAAIGFYSDSKIIKIPHSVSSI